MHHPLNERGYQSFEAGVSPRHLRALAGYLSEVANRPDGGFTADPFVPGALRFSGHNDLVCCSLSDRLQPLVECAAGRPLQPTTTFVRVYPTRSALTAHKDHPHCEVSVTLPIAFDADDLWPIGLANQDYMSARGRGNEAESLSVRQRIGDLLVYLGPQVLHWREPLAGRRWTQFMCHYVTAEPSDRAHLSP